MKNKTLQHNQNFAPTDEAAIKEYLVKNDSVEKNQNARIERLAQMYPQRTDRDQPYGRYTAIDLQAAIAAPQFDVTQSIEWQKLALLGFSLPLPFLALDWPLVALVAMIPISGPVVIAMVGIPYVLAIALTAYLMKLYFDEKIEMIGLNARLLFWSTVLFALPFIQTIRYFLVPEFFNGKMPPAYNVVIYYTVTIASVVGALAGFAYVLYRYNASQEKRLRIIFGIVALPYIIGIALLAYALVQMYTRTAIL